MTSFFNFFSYHMHKPSIRAAQNLADLYSHDGQAGHRDCRSASLFAGFSWPAPSGPSFSYDATKRSPKHAELVILRSENGNRANVRTNDKARRTGNAFLGRARLGRRGVLRREIVALCGLQLRTTRLFTFGQEPSVGWETAICVDMAGLCRGLRHLRHVVLSGSCCARPRGLIEAWRGRLAPSRR